MTQSEAQLQMQVAGYLRSQYPDVLFHSDYGSGVKLTPRQAAIQKRQSGGRRGWPDMFIAAPRHCWHITSERHGIQIGASQVDGTLYYSSVHGGLFLELKKDGTRLEAVRCKPHDPRRGIDNKVYASAHLKEQADCLYGLRQRGYYAEFAVGFDEAKRIIDEYLGGEEA